MNKLSKNVNSNTDRRCFLKCLNKSENPIIELTEVKKFIGRNRETNIDDAFCSRQQICAKANLEAGYVLLKCIGSNKSALNGLVLEQNKPYEAIHGDVIEVIHNRYLYEVVFDPPSQDLNTETKKRQSEEDPEMLASIIGDTAKKVKLFVGDVPKVEEIEIVQPALDNKWEKIDGGKLYIYTPKGCKSSSKIAAYDMDYTLIKTKSGNVFAKDSNDWQIWATEVFRKLQSLHEKEFKIVIFTNQASISRGKMRIEDLKMKIENIVKKLNVPIQVFVSTGKGVYRKPMIGSFEQLRDYKNDGISINMAESLYVGDAAGRPESKPDKRKKDHSAADRLFAMNVGLDFYTPEEHFFKAKKLSWVRPEFDPTNYKIPDNLTVPANAKIASQSCEAIIMVGIPGSGKSYFSKTYFEAEGYTIANRDKLRTWQKCAAVMEDALEAKKRVVIDNTNPDIDSRQRYLEIAKKLKVPVRCFLMATTYKHARHNSLFRELTDANHVALNEMVFNSFKSKYEEPTLAEGFDEIVKINFIPKFKNSEQEKLYKMYLLDK